MKSFTEFNESVEYLEEKLLLINNGKKYGQIVFLAGDTEPKVLRRP